MGVKEVFKQRWVCPKCNSREPRVEKTAWTGTGLSRIFDWQHLEYYVVSCRKCGYTEIYDASVVDSEDKAMSILDLITGT